jgi:hypothetical protein
MQKVITYQVVFCFYQGSRNIFNDNDHILETSELVDVRETDLTCVNVPPIQIQSTNHIQNFLIVQLHGDDILLDESVPEFIVSRKPSVLVTCYLRKLDEQVTPLYFLTYSLYAKHIYKRFVPSTNFYFKKFALNLMIRTTPSA